MQSSKYISCQEIIRNVLRDNNFSDLELTWLDAIEWSAECIDLIGAPKAYINDISCTTIHNYRGLLPCNFHTITQMSGSINGGSLFPMKSSTNTFHPVFTCTDDQLISLSTQNIQIINSDAPIGETINGDLVYDFNGSNDAFVQMPISTNANFDLIGDATYKINDNYIFTSFKTGKVYIAYKSFPVDQDGFPKIPDNIKFKKAVESYIRYKIDYRMWRKGDIEDKIYKDSEKEWLWYVGAASTSMRILSIDQMESLQNQMLHLIPRLNQHSNYFRSLNEREQLTFGAKPWYNRGITTANFI